jgi:hypothetical protein
MFDSIDLPGYVFKSKHRKNVARMRSGGILLGFRENLVNHVQIAPRLALHINNKNKSYTFIDLSKKLNKISQQINKYYDSSSAYV